MAEINLDGEPIFVDVANGPQVPLLYSQLLGNDDSDLEIDNDVNYNKDGDKPNTNAANNISETLEQPQPGNIPQLQQNNDIEITIAGIKMINQRLKCPVCKHYTCESEEKMIRHIRIHRGLNPFKCHMCEYSTPFSTAFQQHVNVHQGVKPYKCTFCDYRTASKSNKLKHELIHSADNSFISPNCKICNRSFSSVTQKRNHYTHQTKCKMCAYVTCSKPLYHIHLQQAHGIKTKRKDKKMLFSCALCPWSANSKPKILLHLIHHPNQTVDEEIVDITVLRNCGIMD